MEVYNQKPSDKEITTRILKRIEKMTSEEIIAFLQYRTPGIEMTDMTGMFSHEPTSSHNSTIKRRTVNP